MGSSRSFAIILSLMLCAIGAAGAFYLWKVVLQPPTPGVEEIQPKADTGLAELDVAREFIGENQLVAAKDRLDYILQHFPESAAAPEARRMLTQLNLDLLFSHVLLPGKGEHVVKKNDTLSELAAKLKTTVRYLQRANNFRETKIIRGETLIYQELKFGVELRKTEKRLVVKRNGEFFAEFPVKRIEMPSGAIPPLTVDVISSGSVLDNGKTVRVTSPSYTKGLPYLRLELAGMYLQVDNRISRKALADTGAFLTREHLEDLVTILRTRRTSVEIIP